MRYIRIRMSQALVDERQGQPNVSIDGDLFFVLDTAWPVPNSTQTVSRVIARTVDQDAAIAIVDALNGA